MLLRTLIFSIALFALSASAARSLDGMVGIHDPSTVIVCDGRYYVYGTGRGISCLISNDGNTWERGPKVFDRVPESVRRYVPKNDGAGVWAPDIIKVDNQYYLYYAISFWGEFVSAVGLVTSPTLDPKDPRYKWTDRGMVVHSTQGEDLNAIDPGVFRAPDGTLWICYGSYHGKIQLVQLDPKTGLRIAPSSPVSIIASQSEASDIISHNGYYYLLVNHGSCCQGKNSTYNIRVGRSRNVTGPYLDRHGDDMARGGGTLFLAAAGKQIGPGHFGRLIENGVEKFSCHYEADLDKGGRPVLDIRPLLWTTDDWPLPGENIQNGVYQIRSQQTGSIIAVKAGGADGSQAQMTPYLTLDNQKWTIAPAAGGFYKILGVESGKALQAAGEPVGGEGVDIAPVTESDAQLWKIDQLSDGSYRIASKASKNAVAAANVKGAAGNAISLQAFTGTDTQRWALAAP